MDDKSCKTQLFEYIENEDHYLKVVEEGILRTEKSLWISTANVKDIRIEWNRKKTISLIELLTDFHKSGIEIRLLHAGKPSKGFVEEFLTLKKRFPVHSCQRVHFKSVIIDGKWSYTGSANITGAGVGMKSDRKRNFEIGFGISDPSTIDKIQSLFNLVWEGAFCDNCYFMKYCPSKIETK